MEATDTKHSIFAPFLFSWSIAQFCAYTLQWRCGNDIGFGIMEYGVGAGYYKYKDMQHLPTF